MSRVRERCAAQAVCSALLFAAAATADAQAPTARSYDEVVAEAVVEFERGNWSEAHALFVQAHALEPNARTLRGLGMAAFNLRRYAVSIGHLEEALAATQRPLDEPLRAQVGALLVRAKTFAGACTFAAEPSDAQVQVDGEEIVLGKKIWLDAGTHTLTAQAKLRAPLELTITVQAGVSQLITARLQLSPQAAPPAQPMAQVSKLPPPPPPPDRLPALLTAAGAVALGGAAATFWLLGKDELSDLERTCRIERCREGDVDEDKLDRYALLTNVALGLSGAALGAATLLWVFP